MTLDTNAEETFDRSTENRPEYGNDGYRDGNLGWVARSPTHRGMLGPLDGSDKCKGDKGQGDSGEGCEDEKAAIALQSDPRERACQDARSPRPRWGLGFTLYGERWDDLVMFHGEGAAQPRSQYAGGAILTPFAEGQPPRPTNHD